MQAEQGQAIAEPEAEQGQAIADPAGISAQLPSSIAVCARHAEQAVQAQPQCHQQGQVTAPATNEPSWCSAECGSCSERGTGLFGGSFVSNVAFPPQK